MKNPVDYNREQRSLRITFEAVEFERLCRLARVWNSSPTKVARESINHVVDSAIANEEKS